MRFYKRKHVKANELDMLTLKGTRNLLDSIVEIKVEFRIRNSTFIMIPAAIAR